MARSLPVTGIDLTKLIDEQTLLQFVFEVFQQLVAGDFRGVLERTSPFEKLVQIAGTLVRQDPSSYATFTSGLLVADALRFFASYYVSNSEASLEVAKSRLRQAALPASSNGLLAEISTYLNVLLDRIPSAYVGRILEQIGSGLRSDYISLLTGGKKPIYHFWPSQIRALNGGLLTEPRFAVRLPASAGKTLLAEMKIANVLSAYPDGLAVYVVPLNALARQVHRDLQERLKQRPLQLRIKVLTGAYEIEDEDLKLAKAESVVITTPEKLDGLLRHRDDIPEIEELLGRARLFVFDECHTLGSGTRGVTYELLIARIVQLFPDAETLAMSAVFENIEDLAKWTGLGRERYVTDTWRPTRLHKVLFDEDGGLVYDTRWRITGYKRTKNTKADVSTLAIDFQKSYRNVLILASTRDLAESYAAFLMSELRKKQEPYLSGDDLTQLRSLATHIRRTVHENCRLADMVEVGVAYHHAYLPSDLKTRIEDYISQGTLKFVASTTTLAEGLNFPLRCVIIPSIYLGREVMSPSQLQNVIGRAGRAHVSTNGQVIIVRNSKYVRFKDDWYSFSDFCFNPPRELLRISSSLEGLEPTTPSADVVGRLQALESQILAFLDTPQLALQDQSTKIAQSSFLTAYKPDVAELKQLIDNRIQAMAGEEPPLLLVGSPYHLTPFGREAKKTGLGLRDTRRIRERIERLVGSDRDFFRSIRTGGQIDHEKLAEILLFIYQPVSNLLNSHALRREGKNLLGLTLTQLKNETVGLLDRLSENLELEKAVEDSLRANDIAMMLRWMSGGTYGELAPYFEAGSEGPQEKLDAALMDAIHFLESLHRQAAWALYATGLFLAFYTTEGTIANVSPEYQNIPLYLRYGVSHPLAVYLVERMKWESRRDAMALCDGVDPEISFSTNLESLRLTLLSFGKEGILRRIGDSERAEALWEALSRADESS
jgi:superfamily II DNA or RNA helicase